MGFFYFTFLPVLGFVLIVITFAHLWRSTLKPEEKVSPPDTANPIIQKNKSHECISLILNVLWGIALLPVSGFALMAGIATLMMTDSGTMSATGVSLVLVIAGLFWIFPIIIVVSIILSFVFRRKRKYRAAILIQIFPLANLVLAFGLLMLGFWLKP